MLRDARTRWTPRVPALVVHRHSVRRSPFSGTMLNLIIPVIRNCRDLAVGSPRLNYQGALACHCRHGPVIQTKTGHSKTGAVRRGGNLVVNEFIDALLSDLRFDKVEMMGMRGPNAWSLHHARSADLWGYMLCAGKA